MLYQECQTCENQWHVEHPAHYQCDKAKEFTVIIPRVVLDENVSKSLYMAISLGFITAEHDDCLLRTSLVFTQSLEKQNIWPFRLSKTCRKGIRKEQQTLNATITNEDETQFLLQDVENIERGSRITTETHFIRCSELLIGLDV